MKVSSYIKENWESTIRQPKDVVHGNIRLPKSFTVPCPTEMFTDFYYWDTYFTNKGLMHDGLVQQVENNLDIMQYFVREMGYIPNANHLTNRSQPPLFTAGVYDLYLLKNDKEVIEKYIDSILKELKFYQEKRMTPIGLSAYGNHATEEELLNEGKGLMVRLGIPIPEERDEILNISSNLLSIAESGWDFTPRFETEKSRFATKDFAHLDLNCILYDAECKASEMLNVVERTEEANHLQRQAAERKRLMWKYMRDSHTGIFYDYNYVNNQFSRVISCASFCVYAVGISNDAKAALKILEKLELDYGLSACEERLGTEYLQWDFPSMWPSNVYFAVNGLKRIGLLSEAKRIAHKYVSAVERCFEQTGKLWEKYDASSGAVSVTREYDTPPMMGWTAGVYLEMKECIK